MLRVGWRGYIPNDFENKTKRRTHKQRERYGEKYKRRDGESARGVAHSELEVGGNSPPGPGSAQAGKAPVH